MDIASQIKGPSGQSKLVIDSTHYVNKVSLCSGSNDDDHISTEFPNSLDGRIKMRVDSILYRPANLHFPVQ
jgi:hypothetical protein